MKQYKILFVLGISISTKSYTILDNYRAMHAYKHDRLDQAKELLEPLFVDDQQNAGAAYNLGKIAYKQGTFSEAEIYFLQAATTAADKQLQMQAFFDAGNAQVKQEKWQEALKSYQEVIARDAAHTYAHEMIEQLKKLLEQQKQKEQSQQQQQQQEQSKQQQKENSQNSEQPNNNSQQDEQQPNEDKHKDQCDKNSKQHDNEQPEKQEEEQNNQHKKENKEQEEENNKENESEANKKERAEQRDNQNANDHFENNKSENKREQEGTQGKEKQQQQQPHGQIGDTAPDGLGDNKQNSKNHNVGQHNNKPSPLPPSQASLQDTQKDEKEQDFNDTPKTAEELLFSLLEERDAALVKEMLKTDVKQQMPRKHGQKNW